MTASIPAPELTPRESAEVAALLAELRECGYRDVDHHGALRAGVRIRHYGHQWPGAYDDGTGVVVAVTEKPDSAWSRTWGKPDVELIAAWDRPGVTGRVSQLAQYHVEVIAR